MMYLWRSKDAYTLLEMLVVLAIVALCSWIMIINIFDVLEYYQVKTVAYKFTNELSALQYISKINQQTAEVRLSDDSYQIYYQQELQEEIQLQGGVMMENNFNDKISFNQFGNIAQGGTVIFYKDDQQVMVKYGIGNGHYRIE